MTKTLKRNLGHKRLYSLKFKMIMTFVLALFVMSMGMFVYYAFNVCQVYEGQAESRLSDLTQLSSTNIDNQIDKINQLSVSMLVDNTVQDILPEINAGKYSGAEEKMDDAKSMVSKAVKTSVFTVTGVLSARIYSLNGEQIKLGNYFLFDPQFGIEGERIIDENGAAVWSVDTTGEYVSLSRAILSTKTMQPVGWLEIICGSTYFDQELVVGNTIDHGKLYLVDEDGIIIASSERNMKNYKFPYELSGLSIDADIIDPSSEETSIYSVGEKLSNGWKLIATVSRSQLNITLKRSVIRAAAFMLLIMVSIIIIVSAIIGHMTKPMQEVRKSMESFGEGNLESRAVIKSRDEIGQIGNAYNQMAVNINNLLNKVYNLELANREAQIEFLKMQINPHFLYNSLDTISWMAYMNGDEKVSDMAIAMARLLRASIQRSDQIPVEQELLLAKDYLNIQSYRFGDKIIVNYDIDPEVETCNMPGFILQPLIENSIIHGLEGKEYGGELRISVKRLGDRIYFCVSDNGVGMDENKVDELLRKCRDSDNSKAIGIINVYRRLHLIYGDECNFHIDSARGKGTIVYFEIPVVLNTVNVTKNRK